MEVHAVRLHKGKRIKPDTALCRDLTVELPHGTAAQVARILILCAALSDRLIDLLKIRIGDDCFPAKHQFSLVRDPERNVAKHLRVRSDHISRHAVPACDRLLKLPAAVCQDHREAVQFPAQKDGMRTDKGPHLFPVLGLPQ